MSQLLKTIQQASKSDKYLCLGYIHQTEDKYQLRPLSVMVGYIILIYYFMNEYFKECTHGLQITNGKLIKTKSRQGYVYVNNIAMTNVQIHSKSNFVASWTLKLSHINSCSPITSYSIRMHLMGVIQSNVHYTISLMQGWAQLIDDYTGRKDIDAIWTRVAKNAAIKVQDVDQIKITLNTKLRQICLSICDSTPVIIAQNIIQNKDLCYTFGISICNPNDMVQLVLFKCSHVH